MGLDMYLEGRTFNWNREKAEKRDGFPVQGVILDLAYWRKHPNLHGFIVREFAGGKDECQEIPLDEDALVKIIDAVKRDALPHTDGFFFGESRPEDKLPTIKMLEKALEWLRGEKPPRMREALAVPGAGITMLAIKVDDFADARESRTVVYRASW